MKKIILLIILIFIDFTLQALQSKIPDDIKDNIQKRVDYGDNTGIVVGLIDGDDVDYFSYGKTDLKNNINVDENSVFEIGSISKVFTTILLADEVNKGNMRLSDPISKYLPKDVKVPNRNGKVITLKDLATHSSGLPRMPDNFKPDNPGNPFADYTVNQMYEFISNYELTKNIGERYEYSNYAMGLLGHILELKTEKSYEQLIVDNIANKYGMKHTGMVITDEMKKNLAKGHSGNQEMENWDFLTLGGAGGIKSTATDMVKFIQANMSNDNFPINKAMQLSHKEAFKNVEGNFKIGLGWHYAPIGDKKIIWHNGQTAGYHSFAGFIEGTTKGVVVLSNSTTNIDDIGIKLLNKSSQIRVPQEKKVKEEINVSELVLDTYVGVYEFIPNVQMTITREEQQLFLQLTGQQRFPAYASSEIDFFLKVVEASITFNKDADGNIESLTLHQNGRDQVAKRIN